MKCAQSTTQPQGPTCDQQWWAHAKKPTLDLAWLLQNGRLRRPAAVHSAPSAQGLVPLEAEAGARGVLRVMLRPRKITRPCKPNHHPCPLTSHLLALRSPPRNAVGPQGVACEHQRFLAGRCDEPCERGQRGLKERHLHRQYKLWTKYKRQLRTWHRMQHPNQAQLVQRLRQGRTLCRLLLAMQLPWCTSCTAQGVANWKKKLPRCL